MVQRCYYEVLACERDATPEDIKKAYRKQALIWHPDKNQNRLEEADAKFKEIQNAYDTLSSPHDRSWYDSHRDQILRGEDPEATSGQRPEDEINLWPYFAPSAFSGYGETGRGFYCVYGELFACLAKQELDVDPDSDYDVDFGGPSSTAAEVSAFYSYWCNFQTKKEFTWADKWNPATAPTRKHRRLMEDDNKKLRRAVWKEYVDTVRQLAVHVRKKDRRVMKYQAEAEIAAREKEEMLKQRRAEQKKKKQQEAAAFEDPEWVKNEKEVLSFEEEELLRKEQQATEEGEQDQEDELYCFACKKRFKNANQWRNHEKSKKHLEKVAELKAELMLDEDLLAEAEAEGGSEEEVEEEEPPPPPPKPDKKGKKREKKAAQKMAAHYQMAQDVAPGKCQSTSDPQHKGRRMPAGEHASDDDAGSDDDSVAEDEEALLASMLARQRMSKSAAEDPSVDMEPSEEEPSDNEGDEDEDDDEDDEDALLARMMGSHKSAAAARAAESDEEGEEEDDDDEEEEEGEEDGGNEDAQLSDRHNKTATARTTEREEADEDRGHSSDDRADDDAEGGAEAEGAEPAAHPDDEDGASAIPRAVKGKGKGRAAVRKLKKQLLEEYLHPGKAKKGAKDLPPSAGAAAPATKKTLDPRRDPLECQGCNMLFATRNQLFTHLKKTGHAAFK